MSSAAAAPAVLFIGSIEEAIGDSRIVDRLAQLGFSVTIKSPAKGDPLGKADVDGERLILISSTVVSDVLRDAFAETPVPVLVMDGQQCEEMRMTYGTAEAFLSMGSLDITYPGHPLAAGLVGKVRVGQEETRILYGTPSARAYRIASLMDAPKHSIIFAYESGEEMVDEFLAPARRVGFLLNDHIIKGAGDEFGPDATIWRLFAAAVLWAAGLIDSPAPKSFRDAFREECGEILDRRYRQRLLLGNGAEEADYTEAATDADCPPENLVGLALSGGGIRSATFSLGLLQGLKNAGALHLFDYLSTVSGGGYCGSWWSAWLAREVKEQRIEAGDLAFPPREGVGPEPRKMFYTDWSADAYDEEGLEDSAAGGAREMKAAVSGGADPVHYLRLFSNHVTPRKDALSGDAWRTVAVVTRNLLLTWLIFVPILFVVILVAQSYFVAQTSEDFIHRPHEAAATTGIIHPYSSATVLKRRVLVTALTLAFFASWLVIITYGWLSSEIGGSWFLNLFSSAAILMLILLGLSIFLPTVDPFNPKDINQFIISISPYLGTLFLWYIGSFLLLIYVFGHTPKQLSAGEPKRRRWFFRGRSLKKPVTQETKVVRVQALLLGFVISLFLLLAFAGFGHEIVEYLFEAGGSYLKKAGGSLAVLFSIVSYIYVYMKSSEQDVKEIETGRLSFKNRIIFAVMPPLFLAVLMIALAWVAHITHGYVLYHFNNALPKINAIILISLLLVNVFAALEIDWRSELNPRRMRSLGSVFVLLFIAILWGVVLHETSAYSLLEPKWMAALAGGTLAILLFRLFAMRRKREEATSPAVRPRLWTLRLRYSRGVTTLMVIILLAFVSLLIFFASLANNQIRPAFELLVLMAPGGFLFCLLVILMEMFLGRGQNHASFWLFLPSIILLAVPLVLNYSSSEDLLLIVMLYIILGLVAFSFGLVVALGSLPSPNVLSLHAFYKERLVQSYLGASNENRYRKRAAVTDSVEDDDMPLKDLNNCRRGAPYHLINATLNLVGGRDLTSTERSSAMFVLSKRFCGSARTLYRRTDEYMSGRLTLGTAATISGSAAGLNMEALGKSSLQVILLAFLNLRLGFWAPAPNGEHWRDTHTRLWPFYMLKDLLSLNREMGNYCYLTDGGHFDNLGLYSLIERGCRFIVVSDATADPNRRFADLGSVIRRCRIDFGTEIALDVGAMKKDEKTKEAATFAIGTISYAKEHLASLGWDAERAVDENHRRGIIILIKPAITPGLNADVRQYALENESFPEQTNKDRFFDEAEFESYRKLGQFCAQQVFAYIGMRGDHVAFHELLKRMESEATALS